LVKELSARHTAKDLPVKSLRRSVHALRKQPAVKPVLGTLLHMMWHWQYWHFGVTWTVWQLAYRCDWRDGELWTVRLGPLWVLLH